jgi:protein TonB
MYKTDNFLNFIILSVCVHIVVLFFIFKPGADSSYVTVPVEVSFFSPLRGAAGASAATSLQEKSVPKPVAQPAQKPVKKAVPDSIKINKAAQKKEVKKQPAQKETPKAKETATASDNLPNAVEQVPQDKQTGNAVSGAAQSEAGGLGEGGISLDNANFKYSYYTTALVRRIRQNWHFVASYGKLRALVHFRIERNGTVTDISVIESSGSDGFDAGAVRALKISSPFPPLPDGFEDPSLGVKLEFKQPS